MRSRRKNHQGHETSPRIPTETGADEGTCGNFLEKLARIRSLYVAHVGVEAPGRER